MVGTETQPSILIQIVQVIIAMFVMDTWQYFVHRYMRISKFLYRHTHSQHHRLVVPYAIGALYNNPLEGLLLDTLGGAISFIISGMTARTVEPTTYRIDVNLHDKVNVNESKSSVGSRSIFYLIKKEESEWWNRLLKQEGITPAFVKVDWDKWVDEDEQDEKGDEDDSDTEEETKEEEAIDKKKFAAPVSNQVEETT
nr:sphinganine C4-monooxygenase 1-like [Tanacetum cinerariifolium]